MLPSQHFTVDCSATYYVVYTVNSVANDLIEKDFVIFKLSKTCLLSRLNVIDAPAHRGLILERLVMRRPSLPLTLVSLQDSQQKWSQLLLR